MSRQFALRLSVALVVTAAAVGGIVLLGDHGDPPPPGTVAVVGEPPAASVPPRTVLSAVSSTPPPAPPRDWKITYELTGSGTATVVYDENGLGLVHQELGVRLPWRTELSWPRTAAPPTVQLLGQGDGALGCRVVAGGSVVVQQSAPAGAVATCAARLG